MPRFDREKMTRMVSELRKALARLRQLVEGPPEDFLASPEKVGSAKYQFIVAVEAAVDMCMHVISRNGLRMPDDYADTFRAMSEAGAFSRELADEMAQLANLRNRMVHLYWEVEDRQVYDFVRSHDIRFNTFLASLGNFLQWPQLR